VEVTNISPHGFWLFIGDRELFASFKQFPWFRDASVREITKVELPSPRHLYWPDLDIDLAVESIERGEIPGGKPGASQEAPTSRESTQTIHQKADAADASTRLKCWRESAIEPHERRVPALDRSWVPRAHGRAKRYQDLRLA